ncbi:hypothetical protein BST55_21900 [Vibrio vulnificus]|nr:hypothetical protein BST51_22030 [Vibrio vulnificus]OZS55685.1 hypothetical protein BST52_22375 [Vibrio vulnificus]OZS60375.1 hypothetical protein BST56_22040 [Vibrio vulnificus]PAO31059.1 hypothetical protein BTT97_21980 [Vibrio vulnificus]PAO52278.1 hypothetical protein BST55_21900 [Vibrio vulnificus]
MMAIVVEFKDRIITRAMLDQIVGNAFRNNLTPPSEIYVKCRGYKNTIPKAVKEYEKNRNVIIHISVCKD